MKDITSVPNYEKIIDSCFKMLHPNGTLPYLQMLFDSGKNCFKSSFDKPGEITISSSYGAFYGLIPFLDKEGRFFLQNTLDIFWSSLEESGKKRIPRGAVSDKVRNYSPDFSKKTDLERIADWNYEAASVLILLQSELLLFERNIDVCLKYKEKAEAVISFIEEKREKNNLLLAGPGSELLFPSFGGKHLSESGVCAPSFPASLNITYAAALSRFAEVAYLCQDAPLESKLKKLINQSKDALNILLTNEGFFLRSLDEDNVPHGKFGSDRHGYFDSVCNIDAVLHETVNMKLREKILTYMDGIKELRQNHLPAVNYPPLDDAPYKSIKDRQYLDSFVYEPGNYTDGGCPSSFEGRAVYAYMSMKRAKDAFDITDIYLKWAEDYRLDKTIAQWGRNTCNPFVQETPDYSYTGKDISITIDGFSPFACLIRSLFSYKVYSDGLLIKVNVPEEINMFVQPDNVLFGNSSLRIRYKGGKTKTALYINSVKTDSSGLDDDCVFIPANKLMEGEFDIFIDRSGEGFAEAEKESKPERTILDENEINVNDELKWAYSRLSRSSRSHALMLCRSIEAANERIITPFTGGNFRSNNKKKTENIKDLYIKTAEELIKIKL